MFHPPCRSGLAGIALSLLLSVDLAAQTHPIWVNELPVKDGHIYAVGVVNRHFEKQAGLDAAAQAARLELAQTIKLNVKTIANSWSGTIGGTGFVSDLEKTLDEDVLASVQNCKVLETWVDPDGLIYALAELALAGSVDALQKKVVDKAKQSAGEKEYKKIEKLEVSLQGLKDPKSYVRKDKPEWISVLPEEDDAIYALGIAEKFYFYVNGRETAKDKSRAELAATIKTEVQAVLTDWYEVNEGSESYGLERHVMEEMAASVSEATLSGSQIVETWYDRDTKWHYALARMSLSNVIQQVKQNASQKTTDTRALKGLSDKLGKLVNRDYLKKKDGRPVWVTKIPQDKDAIFAVGIDEGKYFSETQGIEKAKVAARTKLAKAVEVQVESVTKSWLEASETKDGLGDQMTNDYVSIFTTEATNVCLEGSQIIATFVLKESARKEIDDKKMKSKKGKDKKGKKKKDKDKTENAASQLYETDRTVYYALGRLYSGSLIAKLKKKAAQVVQIPEDTGEETKEEKAERIISGPREKAKSALERLNAALDKMGANQ